MNYTDILLVNITCTPNKEKLRKTEKNKVQSTLNYEKCNPIILTSTTYIRQSPAEPINVSTHNDIRSDL